MHMFWSAWGRTKTSAEHSSVAPKQRVQALMSRDSWAGHVPRRPGVSQLWQTFVSLCTFIHPLSWPLFMQSDTNVCHSCMSLALSGPSLLFGIAVKRDRGIASLSLAWGMNFSQISTHITLWTNGKALTASVFATLFHQAVKNVCLGCTFKAYLHSKQPKGL